MVAEKLSLFSASISYVAVAASGTHHPAHNHIQLACLLDLTFATLIGALIRWLKLKIVQRRSQSKTPRFSGL